MKIWSQFQNASRYGLNFPETDLNWNQVMSRKNKLINGFVKGKGPYLEKMGVDLVSGDARFISNQLIQVAAETYSAAKILIGTGSESILPSVEGIEYALTSKEFLYLEELPKRMVVVGGGIIAMEFAHMLAVGGCQVTLIHRGDRLLKNQDLEISLAVLELTEKHGITIRLQSEVKKIEKTESGQLELLIQGKESAETIVTDEVLMAIGRKPALSGMNLEVAGINYEETGIIVNQYFQTTNKNVYAAGDVIGGEMFTTLAAQEAKFAARNALTGNKHLLNIKNISRAVFTMPPIASVGYTADEAEEAGFDPVVGKVPYAHSAAGILMGETEGFLKIVADRNSRQIIGAHFIGEEADELIHLITVAIKGQLTVDDFIDIIPVHPTLAETVVEAIRAIDF